jgi:hypothetical protein
MSDSLCDFDMKAFHAALDAQRQARRLSWTELATSTAVVND